METLHAIRGMQATNSLLHEPEKPSVTAWPNLYFHLTLRQNTNPDGSRHTVPEACEVRSPVNTQSSTKARRKQLYEP